MGATSSHQRRKTETAILDSRGRPVQLLYDETNDKTIMQRGATDGSSHVKITSPLESNGAIPVNVQDQHSRAFDLFFAKDVGSPTTLTVDTVVDSYTVYCTTGHGLIAGDLFVIIDPVAQHGHTAKVVSIAGNNEVNMDRPMSYVLAAASSIVQERTDEMAVDGSGTRQVYTIGSPLTAELDIVRLMFQITSTDPALWSLFGDQAALTRGVLFRQTSLTNGTINHWNIKENNEFAHLMYDVQFFNSAHPQAVNGLAGRLTYGSQGKHGVTLRIGGGEELQVIIQDDIDGLLSFKVMAQGHIVTD